MLFKKNIFENFLSQPKDVEEQEVFFVLTLIVGILCGLIAVLVQKLVDFLTHFFQTHQAFSWWSLAWGGAAILVSGFITTRICSFTSGSGIPNLKLALVARNGRVSFKEAFFKLITSILTLSSGMSLGKEGPIATTMGGFGSYLGDRFGLPPSKIKVLLAVGAAGGISAAFNTPIAGVIFALEEIVGDLSARRLGAIVISSVTASITASMFLGNHPTFSELHYHLLDKRELIFYLVIGILASALGPLWMHSVVRLKKLNNKIFKGHRLSIIIISFLIIAILSRFIPEILGSGHHTIDKMLLSHILDWKILFLLFAMKFIATTISYSSGLSGGLFMPTLFIGAALGGFVGALAKNFFPEITAGVGPYAIVGMGAFFIAVIRAPFTSMIMIFEMTHNYNIILPLMTANITAYALSSLWQKHSIYEEISEADGVHLPHKEEDQEVLETLTVSETMTHEVLSLNALLTVGESFELTKNMPAAGYPVVQSGKLFGIISRKDIRFLLKNKEENEHKKLAEVCKRQVFTIYADQSLMLALHRLYKYKISRLPVVSRIEDKKIIGIITAKDIVGRFGHRLLDEEDIIAKENS